MFRHFIHDLFINNYKLCTNHIFNGAEYYRLHVWIININIITFLVLRNFSVSKSLVIYTMRRINTQCIQRDSSSIPANESLNEEF